MTWLTKRRAAALLLVPALAVVLLGTRTWVTGRSDDAVLAGRMLSVTGDQAAPGLVALGLVALAAGVAVLTSGRRLRLVSSVLLTLAALGVLVLTLSVLRDPTAALSSGSGPGSAPGTVGGGPTTVTGATTPGALTVWPWPALVAALLLTVVGAGTVVAGRGWDGLSSRFERSADEAPDDAADRRSAWDELSEGRDPTDRNA